MQQRTVSFGEAISRLFTRWTINGRASRSEYWWAELFSYLFWVVPFLNLITGPISTIVLIIPRICLGVRRLHDTGRSGWWLLLIPSPIVVFWLAAVGHSASCLWLMLIPVAGWITLFVFTLMPSQETENKYGPVPNVVEG